MIPQENSSNLIQTLKSQLDVLFIECTNRVLFIDSDLLNLINAQYTDSFFFFLFPFSSFRDFLEKKTSFQKIDILGTLGNLCCS